MASKILPPDFLIDEPLAAILVHAQFDIDIFSCRVIGEGFDNAVFLINEHLVFRFPRRRIAIALLEHEVRLLGSLSQVLDIAIPEPLYIGLPSNSYDAPFYGHELVVGRTGCSVTLSSAKQQQLAYDLGHFLKDLHRVDTTKLSLTPDLLQPVFDRVDKVQMLTWLLERFAVVKEPYNLEYFMPRLDAIISDADAYIPKQEPAVLVHSDLYNRHLLFDQEDLLCGVIDWGDSCLSDRVVDFSVVYQFLPEAVHDSFYKSYGSVSKEEQDYGRFLGLYYAIALLWFGHDRHDKALIKSSLETLQFI